VEERERKGPGSEARTYFQVRTGGNPRQRNERTQNRGMYGFQSAVFARTKSEIIDGCKKIRKMWQGKF
jgi:hypothetical protein